MPVTDPIRKAALNRANYLRRKAEKQRAAKKAERLRENSRRRNRNLLRRMIKANKCKTLQKLKRNTGLEYIPPGTIEERVAFIRNATDQSFLKELRLYAEGKKLDPEEFLALYTNFEQQPEVQEPMQFALQAWKRRRPQSSADDIALKRSELRRKFEANLVKRVIGVMESKERMKREKEEERKAAAIKKGWEIYQSETPKSMDRAIIHSKIHAHYCLTTTCCDDKLCSKCEQAVEAEVDQRMAVLYPPPAIQDLDKARLNYQAIALLCRVCNEKFHPNKLVFCDLCEMVVRQLQV